MTDVSSICHHQNQVKSTTHSTLVTPSRGSIGIFSFSFFVPNNSFFLVEPVEWWSAKVKQFPMCLMCLQPEEAQGSHLFYEEGKDSQNFKWFLVFNELFFSILYNFFFMVLQIIMDPNAPILPLGLLKHQSILLTTVLVRRYSYPHDLTIQSNYTFF